MCWINPNTIKNKHSEKNTCCFCGNMKSITMKNICLNTMTKEDHRANAPHWPYYTFCYEDFRALLLARPYLSNKNSQKLIPKNVGLIYKPIWYNNSRCIYNLNTKKSSVRIETFNTNSTLDKGSIDSRLKISTIRYFKSTKLYSILKYSQTNKCSFVLIEYLCQNLKKWHNNFIHLQ